MFDLHRLHLKRVCVTSCAGQLFKGIRGLCKRLQGLLMHNGELKLRIKDKQRATDLKAWLEHQETLLLGLNSVLTDGQKLYAALHIMTTVIYRDGVLNNTECEPLYAEEVRFMNTIGKRFIISAERLASLYSQPGPEARRPEVRTVVPCAAEEHRRRVGKEADWPTAWC